MSISSPKESERPEIQDVSQALALIEQAQRITLRHSVDNGVTLFIWGMAFLLDMIAFDVSRLLHSVFPALVFVVCLNSAILVWRLWYGQRSPIRLRKVLTNRVIFWWSFYYVPLIGFGVGGWIFLIGPYPPCWFSLLGVLGALPLFSNAIRQRRRVRQRV